MIDQIRSFKVQVEKCEKILSETNIISSERQKHEITLGDCRAALRCLTQATVCDESDPNFYFPKRIFEILILH